MSASTSKPKPKPKGGDPSKIFTILRNGGDSTELEALLQADPRSASARNPKGQSPLHVAAEDQNWSAADVLLRDGANVDVDLQDKDGKTPLHCAVMGAADDIVELIMRKGASPAIKDAEGNNALHWVARSGILEIAENLLGENDESDDETSQPKLKERVSMLRAENQQRNTPLHLAAAEPGYRHLANYFLNLLSASPDCKKVLDSQNDEGFTPLHVACSTGDVSVVQRLLELKASAVLPTKAGETILHLAVQSGDNPILKAILDLRSDMEAGEWASFLNALDKSGHAALHYAAQNAMQDVAAMLLGASEIDVNLKTTSGASAIVLASRQNHKEMVDLLKEKGANVDDIADDEAKIKEAKEAALRKRGDYSSQASSNSVVPPKEPPASHTGSNAVQVVVVVALLVFLVVTMVSLFPQGSVE